MLARREEPSMNSKATYEAIWDRKRGGGDSIPEGSRSAVALELLAALDNSSTDRRALDVGCGDGLLGAALLQRFGEAHGVDIAATAIARARSLGVNAVQVNLDAEPLPYPDGMFAVVTCLDVLEHVFDPRVLIEEIARVCAPGGLVIITTPNIRYWKHIVSVIGGRFPRTSSDNEGYDGGHLHYYTANNITDLLDAHFVIQRIQGVQGSARRGLAASMFGLIMPGRLGAEFAYPGIAVAARRRPDAHNAGHTL
jgi:methionine biosynthesis protein MetW